MAIYGQSWRQPFGAQFSGNMSFRNPMTKAPMNNNPMGNQQSMRPNGNNALQPTVGNDDMPNGVNAFAGEPREVMRSLAPYRSPTSEMTSFRDTKERARAYSQSYGNGRAYDKFHLQDYPAEFAKEQGWDPPAPSPLPPHPTNAMMARHGFSHPAPVDYASKNSIGAVASGLSLTRKPNLFDAMQQANIRQKMQIPPPTGNPTQSNLPNPNVQSPVGMSMPNGLDAFQSTPAPSLQQRRQQWQQIAAGTPQYINPEFQAGQANMQRLNQSMAQTLNRPLQRRADAIAGVQPGPMINRNAARNVLMGQSPDADLSMRPLNLPPRNMYEANGINPGEFRNNPSVAMNAFPDSDNFRVATGGMAMYPPGSGGQVSGGNSMSQAGISSVANARIARAARQRGVTSSGIDQWRKTSPIAQTIQSNADTRIANLPQNPAPQVQPVTVQSAPTTIPQTPAVVQQAQSNQNAGINNWPDSGTLQTNPVSPIQRTGTNEIIVPQGRIVEGRDYPAKYMMNPGFSPKVQQNWRPLPPRPPITYKQPTFGNLYRQAIGIFQ